MKCGRHLFHRDGSDDRSPLESSRSAHRHPEQPEPIDARHLRGALRIRRHAEGRLQVTAMGAVLLRGALPFRDNRDDPVENQSHKTAGRVASFDTSLRYLRANGRANGRMNGDG